MHVFCYVYVYMWSSTQAFGMHGQCHAVLCVEVQMACRLVHGSGCVCLFKPWNQNLCCMQRQGICAPALMLPMICHPSADQ